MTASDFVETRDKRKNTDGQSTQLPELVLNR